MKDWKKATVYQIYPRSFQDSNGDGVGDIQGIISRLDYLKDLGAEVLWLNPVYKSPGRDNGYDIADYYEINPEFGTMDDFEQLLDGTRNRGMKIIMDLVVNHTSDQHEWFKMSRDSKDNPYHDYYIWKDPVDGHEPNNWKSKFGGSAWEYDEKLNQYYLHLYDRTQPDLNWRNPKMKASIMEMMKWWADKGIAGFRLDVINNISKPLEMPDDTLETSMDDGRKFYTNGPHVHEYIHEMYEEVFGKHSMLTVGELSSTPIDEAIKFTNPDREELTMAFTFHHVKVDYPNGAKWVKSGYKLVDLKKVISDWQIGMQNGGGWNALFWGNHDQPRAISRFLDDNKYREESAKLLALVEFGLQGTPYVYQGEEIAMKNAYFTDISQYNDPESINAYHELVEKGSSVQEAIEILQQKSRENSRLPMQWDSQKNYGFTTGSPWLKAINKDTQTVESEIAKKDGVLSFYKKLIEFRRNEPILIDGNYQLLDENNPDIFYFKRELNGHHISVIANFSDKDIVYKIDDLGTVKFSNYKETILENGELKLRPYEAVLFQD
ncbi:alpha,alpha-phosphotrehalase [Companilactobacillus metriopterae]|uniref:alpha,alpha-phosphotrehalase n=1 Tax=Companilactobacillus metriopterae TaxID=1909267 RepID=UPI00100C3007|nr:alpha,alpha-phosphotrehalase [Companilactobacillus metriopterae]